MFVVRSAISFKKLISEMRVQPLPKNSGTICFTNAFLAGGNIVRWPEFHPFANGTFGSEWRKNRDGMPGNVRTAVKQ